MRITSAGGTDVRYGLSQYPVISEYGYTDEPGRWDHCWPSDFVFTQGTDGEIDILNEGSFVPAELRAPGKRGGMAN